MQTLWSFERELNLKVIWSHLVWVILDILLAATMFCGNAMATSKCWLSSRLTASCAWSVNKQRNLVPRVSVWHISQALHSLNKKKSQPVIQSKCYSARVINFLLLTLVYTNSNKLGINHAWSNSEGKSSLLQIFLLFLLSSTFFFSSASPCCFLDILVCLLSLRCDLFQKKRLEIWSVKYQVLARKSKGVVSSGFSAQEQVHMVSSLLQMRAQHHVST